MIIPRPTFEIWGPIKVIAFLENPGCSEFNLGDLRAEIVARYFAKKKAGFVQEGKIESSFELLNRLYQSDRLWLQRRQVDDGTKIDIYYTPSSEAIERIQAGEDAWSKTLGNKARRKIRISNGVILKFVSEDKQASIDVFTTDWSPSPAACAIALHRLHPFLSRCLDVPLTGSHFTGEYVRHPLTGDLLPVWTADWVRADFGTGAVLVNPAHSQADLEFGRKVGLPIKFSLIPDYASDDPNFWPQPPVIRDGTITRSGRFDGLKWDEAEAAFYKVLQARGLAAKVADKSLGSVPIASISFSNTGSFSVLTNCKFLGAAQEQETRRANVEFSAIYRCIDRVLSCGAETIVASSSSMKKVGPAVISLLMDIGVEYPDIDLFVTGHAECNIQRISDSKLRLALLVGGDMWEPLSVNQQLVEQVDGFLKSLHQCRTELGGGELSPPDDIKRHLKHDRPKEAFRSLVRWQRECLRDNRKVDINALDKTCSWFLLPTLSKT
ncbi:MULTISPECIES: hypothetical protein [Marinobacter]|uniref:hypothetical protein n=1 Tax=Marinobacter TaxID=2742 RepID=UPI003B437A34|nr:class I tRNA ligase family protein [Marinobacter alkaliphilus]